MNDLDPQLRSKFEALVNRLSPENLSCDGECNGVQTRMRYRRIMTEWKSLEHQANRKVTQEEIEEEQSKKWSSPQWKRSNDLKAANILKSVLKEI